MLRKGLAPLGPRDSASITSHQKTRGRALPASRLQVLLSATIASHAKRCPRFEGAAPQGIPVRIRARASSSPAAGRRLVLDHLTLLQDNLLKSLLDFVVAVGWIGWQRLMEWRDARHARAVLGHGEEVVKGIERKRDVS